MKAILVTFSLTTRIIVDDDFNINEPSYQDYGTIRAKAVPKFHEKLDTEGIGDILPADGLEEDFECPYEEGEENH